MLLTQPSIPPVINCRSIPPSCTLALLLPSFRNLCSSCSERGYDPTLSIFVHASVHTTLPFSFMTAQPTHPTRPRALSSSMLARSIRRGFDLVLALSLPGLYSPSSTRLPLARRASLPSLAPCAPPHSAILTPPPPHSALLTPPPPHSLAHPGSDSASC